jgi:hypothetical protein
MKVYSLKDIEEKKIITLLRLVKEKGRVKRKK